MKFDALDEPMPCDRPAGSADTQTIRFIRCEVCGIAVWGDPESGEPPVGTLCPGCDDKTRAARVDLLTKVYAVPREERAAGDVD